jgi:NADH-quinone oxidoreductase subunit F
VHRIEHGEGRPEDLDLLNRVTDNIMGKTICALGDAAAFPVRSFIKHFRKRVRVPHREQEVPGRSGSAADAGSGFFKAGAA